MENIFFFILVWLEQDSLDKHLRKAQPIWFCEPACVTLTIEKHQNIDRLAELIYRKMDMIMVPRN